MADVTDDEPVPKLPRGRGLKLDGPMMFRIGATLCLLIMIIVMRKPCANATSKFVTGFGDDGSAGVVPKPGTIDVPVGSGSAKPTGDGMEHVGPGASEEEVRAAWERTRAKAKAAEGSAAAGSGSAGSAGSGSAAR